MCHILPAGGNKFKEDRVKVIVGYRRLKPRLEVSARHGQLLITFIPSCGDIFAHLAAAARSNVMKQVTQALEPGTREGLSEREAITYGSTNLAVRIFRRIMLTLVMHDHS